MAGFQSEGEYLSHLSHHALMPEGFQVRTTQIDFNPTEKPSVTAQMNIACVVGDEPFAAVAGLFTTNQIPGAPVVVTRRRITGDHVRGLVVNNKIANVCVAGAVEDAETVSETVGRRVGVDGEDILVAATGVIGWRLPVPLMQAAVEGMFADGEGSGSVSSASDHPAEEGRKRPVPGDALDLARAIMTTDSYPKLYSRTVGRGRIVGVAKGAGMIEPHMATMLSFVFTDLTVGRSRLRKALQDAVEGSFNSVSVDGDQSTSDMLLAFSSGKIPCGEDDEFERALADVCGVLAADVVRNGEGVGHVIRVTVTGAPDDTIARDLGRAVVNSPLVKTAVNGNDPNVGRIVMAVGDFCGRARVAPKGLSITLGDAVVYENGHFKLDSALEDRLGEYLRSSAQDPTIKGYPQTDAVVDLEIRLDTGNGNASVLGADLSHEYVRENADYRT
jgi:glutamate N-acetyltransferase/amino-acid N-acetyltransferase